jgi:hypothetical protein
MFEAVGYERDILENKANPGIVTLLKWDKILPDGQDYLNLAPLPIRSRAVLAANAAAIAIAVVIFAVDVNAVPAFLFPLFVTTAAGFRNARRSARRRIGGDSSVRRDLAVSCKLQFRQAQPQSQQVEHVQGRRRRPGIPPGERERRRQHQGRQEGQNHAARHRECLVLARVQNGAENR